MFVDLSEVKIENVLSGDVRSTISEPIFFIQREVVLRNKLCICSPSRIVRLTHVYDHSEAEFRSVPVI